MRGLANPTKATKLNATPTKIKPTAQNKKRGELSRGVLTLAGGATAPPDPPFKSASGLPKNRPKTRPDHPGLSRDSIFRPENSKRTRPDQFRPTFGPWPKVPKAKKPTFAL